MDATCPNCGSPGRGATLADLELYKCTNSHCRTEFRVPHPQCAYPGCTAWTDSGMPYCFCHAGRLGITPASWGDQHPCAGRLCPNMLDAGQEYCEQCAEARRNEWE